MAVFIPSRTEKIAGIPDVEIVLKAEKPYNDFDETMFNTTKCDFEGFELIIESVAYLVDKVEYKIIPVKNYTIEELKILYDKFKVLGKCEFIYAPDWIEIDYPGYVQRDFILKAIISKRRRIYITTWDILPETEERFEFQSKIFKTYSYFCEECCDDHEGEETLEKKYYKTEKEAREGHAELIKKYRKLKS